MQKVDNNSLDALDSNIVSRFIVLIRDPDRVLRERFGLFKIGEFSLLVRVTPRMLRHYEKCGLVQPASIDETSGYRLFKQREA